MLLTLLADSVMAGVAAFLFATVVITIAGEIVSQAWFSRHALKVAGRLAPLLRVYRVLLWPVAWPSGKLLDAWIGPEGIPWYRERELRQILEHHARNGDTEISRVEAAGAINFLALDDLPVGQEGEPLDPKSVIRLPFHENRPLFPEIGAPRRRSVPAPPCRVRQKMGGFVDARDEPHLVADAPALRGKRSPLGVAEARVKILRINIMTKIRILAANSGNATLFAADSPTAPLTELMTFDNPEARAKQMKLTSDRPGRSFDSHGEGRHAMEVQVEPKEQEQIRFAKLIADRLERGRVDNDFKRLVVVAAPAFLGQLRTNFGAPLSSLVSLEMDKDYTALRPVDLRARLPERL